MARLTTSERNALPNSAFAGPNRSYPINDPGHAKAALSMSSRYASPAVKSEVRKDVAKKYPGMVHYPPLSHLGRQK